MSENERKPGRPVEYPDSPIHAYWRAQKERDKKIAEQAKAEALKELELKEEA